MIDLDHSVTIRHRLVGLLSNTYSEQALLRHIEVITTCDFPADKPMLNRLIDKISNKPDMVRSVKAGYDVWKAIRDEDRLYVIHYFLLLFNEHTPTFSAAQNIELFCRLFLRDFIPVLAEYDASKPSNCTDL